MGLLLRARNGFMNLSPREASPLLLLLTLHGQSGFKRSSASRRDASPTALSMKVRMQTLGTALIAGVRVRLRPTATVPENSRADRFSQPRGLIYARQHIIYDINNHTRLSGRFSTCALTWSECPRDFASISERLLARKQTNLDCVTAARHAKAPARCTSMNMQRASSLC